LCYDNQLTSLDVSQNTALTILWCDDNQLTSLDVSQNTALTILWCDDNQLTSLDVSQNTALFNLSCADNQLTSLDVRNGNNTHFTGFYATNNPNLYCINVDDDAFSTFNWIGANYFSFDSQSYFSNNCGSK
jgi:Leucine-rich repeat (LRR) protein